MTQLSWVALHSWLMVSLNYTRLWSMRSVWLVFYDCGFHSVCPLMDKDQNLMVASWRERLTEGETGSCSDGQGLLSKSNFLLMVGAVFPPYCLTWGQTMVEVIKIVATSFKRSHAGIAELSSPDPAPGHHWPMPLQTHASAGDSWTLTGKSGSRLLGEIPWLNISPGAGKDWRWEKGMTEDEMVEWHHWLDGHEFEYALGVGDGQGSLVCCSPWGHKESDMTEWLNWLPSI